MKFIPAVLFPAIALAQTAAMAQSPAPAKPHPAATHAATPASATASKAGCVPLPPLSPKIPALPATAPCAKALYTLTVEPSIKMDYTSPLEGPALREDLGLESTSFSLDYIDTKVGTGELAARHKWYSIQYTGYLVDGTKFDSSLDRPGHEPFVFHYGEHQVVAGWDTGFAGMHVGGKRRLFIPWQLAYGPNAHGSIPAKSMLIFDVELVAQHDVDPTPKPAPAAAAPIPGKPAMPSVQAAPTTSQPATSTPPAQPAPATAPPATPPAATPKPQ